MSERMTDPHADTIANYLAQHGPISVIDLASALHILPMYIDKAIVYESVYRSSQRFRQVMMDDGPWLEPTTERIEVDNVKAFKDKARARVRGYWRLKDPKAWKKAHEDIVKKLKSFGMKQSVVRSGDSFKATKLSMPEAKALQAKIAQWWKQDLLKKGYKASKGHSGALYFLENRDIDVSLTLYMTKRREGVDITIVAE